MLDFTSALYLGFHQPHGSLQPWQSFTTGKPAVLDESQHNDDLKKRLAKLIGLENVSLGSSSFHLFWDVLGQLDARTWHIFIDEYNYPIAQWAVARAAAHGVAVNRFQHHNSQALKSLIAQYPNKRPFVITDGVCPLCSKNAPVSEYLNLLRTQEGLLLIDDTQALGVLGRNPDAFNPYGYGGGGLLNYEQSKNNSILLISSLAKGLGVPMAILGGSNHNIAIFENRSETRVHCSPPSQAVLSAAKHSLILNQKRGDIQRQKLLDNISYFQMYLKGKGYNPQATLFPVQNFPLSSNKATKRLYQYLQRSGIKCLMQRGHNNQSRLSFIFTAIHSRAHIERLIQYLPDAKPLSKSYLEDQNERQYRTI